MIEPSRARRCFLLGTATVLTSPELAASLGKTGSTASIDIVRIAAASDLSFALPEILQHIEKNLGIGLDENLTGLWIAFCRPTLSQDP